MYNIRFDNRDETKVFGQRYWFYLQDAVEDVPEYVVHWEDFQKCVLLNVQSGCIHSLSAYFSFLSFLFRLALQYGLHLLYKEEFQEIYNREHGHPEYGPLLEKMKVVDADGTSQMDEDQWEAASAYSTPSTSTFLSFLHFFTVADGTRV